MTNSLRIFLGYRGKILAALNKDKNTQLSYFVYNFGGCQ